MTKLLTILSFILLVISCQINQTNKERDSPVSGFIDSTIHVAKFSIIDSLNKYTGADSLFEYKNQNIYVGKFNEENIGLVQTSDTTTIIFQKILNTWTVTDTLKYPLLIISPVDLNGDDFKDIIITYYVTGSGGNSQNVCLLYSPTLKQFEHNEHFDLPNIHYDKKRNMVFSAWYSGVANPQEKQAYKIKGDRLTLIEGVVFQPDAMIEFYKMRDDKKVVYKKIKGSYEIFSKALWNSSNDL